MCDSLCSLQPERTLFAKNSDRPPNEAQVVELHPARPGGATLATTYLELEDPGAAALIGSRPAWQWGLEHGVNQHGVAIGNEQVWTVDDPSSVPPALTGLDLVRLGLERGRCATDALDHLTSLLERHGQGGIADRQEAKAYFSSFLITDPTEAWILETSGRTWAARRVDPAEGGAALSNRISLSTDWTRASPEVARAGDFDRWRRASSPTAHADRRLAVTRAAVAPHHVGSGPTPAGDLATERDLAAVLRDHGRRPDGPSRAAPRVDPLPPAVIDRMGTGVSVCLHLTGVQATTAAMIVSTPRHPGRPEPIRAWAALGSPCASLFVPLFPFDDHLDDHLDGDQVRPGLLPAELADPSTWARFAALRDRLESTRANEPARADQLLADLSGRLGRLEDELWAEADEVARAGTGPRRQWTTTVWPRVEQLLGDLGV